MKMLIVDDEPIIREGLKQTIPWDECGIHSIDIASNGQKALANIEQEDMYDIILTDIKMPKMDGLQLVEELYAQGKDNTRVIMLSGYDEFDYAKRAMCVGVKNYLLKPVNVDEMMATVKSVVNEVNEKRCESIKAAVSSQLISGESSALDDVSVFPFVSSMPSFASQVSSISEVEKKQLEKQWIRSIENVLKKAKVSGFSLFLEENILFTCVYRWDTDVQAIDRITKQFEELDFHFSLLEVASTINEVNETYDKLKRSLQEAFILDQKVMVSTDVPQAEQERRAPREFQHTLIDALFKQNETKMKQAANELATYIKEEKYLLNEVVRIYQELERAIIMNYEKETRYKQQLEISLKMDNVSTNIYNAYHLIDQTFFEDLDQLYHNIHSETSSNNNWIIDRAVEYIKEYYVKDIKASEVADVVNISPNYFSSLFKQQTGQNSNQYLNSYRVEKAKEYLDETPFKVTYIAEKVGYQEYKYFVYIFKKLTNMTPTEYRNLICSKQA